MNVFAEYAEYYDLFYKDKDYAGEAAFVRRLIRKRLPRAQSVLELGCGTGRHAIELVRAGFAVTGIDLSKRMVAHARDAARGLPAKWRDRFLVELGDVTNFRSAQLHDAVVSLFHVINYQTTNEALHAMFASARQALKTGGTFLFDFWYGPAVLTDRPTVRIRRITTREVEVTRIAEPMLHTDRNVVDVNYSLLVTHRQSGQAKEFRETHVMRFLFLPEIKMLAEANGFELLDSGEWLTQRPLTDKTWLGWALARAV